MTTILHLSDLHFGKDHFYRDGDSASLRSSLVNDLKTLKSKPDCVVISGDLTTQGALDGLELAVKFVRHLSGDLGIPMASFVLVPGNHEVDWNAVEDKKKTTSNARELSLAGLDAYRQRVVVELFGRARDEFLTTYWTDGSVFVLGLNSCYFEGKDHAGVGYVDPQQWVRAQEELGDKWERCDTRIAVLHHHLVPVTHTSLRPNPKEISLTLNAPDILDRLAKNGFQIALHGHQHQPFCAREVRYLKSAQDQGVIVLGAGSAGVTGPRLGSVGRNHYQILEVGGGRLKVRSRTRHSAAPETFEDYQNLDLPLGAMPATLEQAVNDIGLRDFLWFDDVPWKTYFEKAKDVEAFALSARFLLINKIDIVRTFLQRSGTKLTLVVHDPKDEEGLAIFDKHIGEDPGKRRTKIEEVLSEIEGLRKDSRTRGEIQVRFIRGPLHFRYTYYRFDDVVLYVPYRNSSYRGAGDIPVFVMRSSTLDEKFLGPDRRMVLDKSLLG